MNGKLDRDIRARYLRRSGAAVRLSCSQSWLRKLAADGHGPPMLKISGAVFYPIDALDKWARSHATKSEAAVQ